jgi:hypothetical protein
LAAGVSRNSLALRAPVLFLSFATWLCYVGDRLLDARSSPSPESLRARHYFYGALWRERRSALGVMVVAAALGCAAIALYGLPASLLASFTALTGVSLLYFGRVHARAARNGTPLAKEAAVGAIFAIGCLLPGWTAARPEARPHLALTGVLFALLCWLNCVAIERWESHGSISASAHSSTRWAAERLSWLLAAGGILSGVLGFLWREPTNGNFGMLAPCLGAAFVLLGVLESLRRRLSSDALRILADVALLTPLAWWAVVSIAS